MIGYLLFRESDIKLILNNIFHVTCRYNHHRQWRDDDATLRENAQKERKWVVKPAESSNLVVVVVVVATHTHYVTLLCNVWDRFHSIQLLLHASYISSCMELYGVVGVVGVAWSCMELHGVGSGIKSLANIAVWHAGGNSTLYTILVMCHETTHKW